MVPNLVTDLLLLSQGIKAKTEVNKNHKNLQDRRKEIKEKRYLRTTSTKI